MERTAWPASVSPTGASLEETHGELVYSIVLLVSRKKLSAGLMMCRKVNEEVQVLLVHPGGPYFRNKDAGAWTVPKGLVDEGEDLLETAKREFVEETGFALEAEVFVAFGEVKMKSSSKRVHAWAFVGDCDPDALDSNTFEIEWPPRSGKTQSFPEADRAGWFGREAALEKILEAQRPFVERLLEAESLDKLFG